MSSPSTPRADDPLSYWLVVESEHLTHEYGLNDRRGLGEEKGGRHYLELPADVFLREGPNTAYIRPALALPPRGADPQEAEGAEDVEARRAFARLGLRIMNLRTRESLLIPLMSLQYDPVTGGMRVEGVSREIRWTASVGGAPTPLPAVPDQGREEGFAVQFTLTGGAFDPLPREQGAPLAAGPDLEAEVRAALGDLLALYQARDYGGLVAAYDAPWGHVARTYTYGQDARHYADAINFTDDLNDPAYEFVLDFDSCTMRIEGEGRLATFSPPPLKARLVTGFVALEIPTWFMRRPDGALVLSS